jgi:hypothetical protein
MTHLVHRWASQTIVLASLFCSGALPAAGATGDGQCVLTLTQALQYRLKSGEAVTADLTVAIERQGGKWLADAYATAEKYNNGLHLVTVEVADAKGPDLELDVTLTRAGGTGWGENTGPEGVAHYSVKLAAVGDAWTGGFSGGLQQTYHGKPLADGLKYERSGQAAMRTAPPSRLTVAGHKPPAAGEHPRLFFRAGDLEQLRKRAQTDIGRKFIARTRELLDRNAGGFAWNRDGSKGVPYTEGTHAAGHAFLYALTGEPAQAERARWMAFRAMAANGGEWGSWGNSLRIPGVAVAYDLCHDAWKKSDPAFVHDAGAWLEAAAVGRGANPDTHFDGTFHAAGGLAALAVLGDPCPSPREPCDPAAAALLPAPEGFSPVAGAPVFDFTDGQIAKKWLLAGGFSPGYGGEPLKAIGGPGAARPSAGDKFRQGDAEFDWVERTFDAPRIGLYKFEVKPAPKGAGPADFARDGGLPVLAYFHAVLDNDKPRAVQAWPRATGAWQGPDMPIPGVRLWIAGRQLANGDVVRLQRGKYPVTMELSFAGQMLIAPRLLEYTAERFAADQARHRRERGAWEAAGKAWPDAPARCRRMARFIERYVDLCYGDAGFVTEDSTQADAIYNLLPYLVAYGNVTGRDIIAAHPHVRRIMPHIVLTQRRFLRHDWGVEHFRVMGFPELCDDTSRRLLRGEIDRAQAGGGLGQVDSGSLTLPWDGMFAMLNYPFDGGVPRREDAFLPRVLEDKRFGGYVLTRQAGRREFQAILLCQQNAPRSSVTAGDFSILVDGRLWTGYGNAGGGFFRPACLTKVEIPNVVRVQGAIPTRGARRLHFEKLGDDGSAVLSMVQDYWVDGSADDAHSAPKVNDPANIGVRAVRSIAVDYSGRCGAPMLVAVADCVTAPGQRAVWTQMNLPGTDGHNNEGRFATKGSTFQLAEPKAQLADPNRATLAGASFGPAAGVLIEYRGDWAEMCDPGRPPPHFQAAVKATLPRTEDAAGKAAPPKRRKPDSHDDVLAEMDAFQAATKPATQPAAALPPVETFYLAVFTVQEGKPPAIRAEGRDRDTRLAIAGRTVRFNGARIVLGDAP